MPRKTKTKPRKKHPVEFKLRLTFKQSEALRQRAVTLGVDKSDVLRMTISSWELT